MAINNINREFEVFIVLNNLLSTSSDIYFNIYKKSITLIHYINNN